MKNLIKYLPLVLIVTVFFLTGCVSQSKYDELNTNYQSLIIKWQNLSAENQVLKTENAKLEIDFDNLQDEHSNLLSKYSLTESKNADTAAKLSQVQAQLNQAKIDNDSLNKGLANLQTQYSELEKNYQTLKSQLAQINEVYPPGYFASGDELLAWLKNDDISEREHHSDPVLEFKYAKELQERALKDGYIINVQVAPLGGTPNFYQIYCTAMTADNTFYFWNLNVDNINYMIRDITDFIWLVGGN